MSVLPTSVNYMHAWYLQRSEEDVTFLGTGERNGYEPPYGYQKPNQVLFKSSKYF